MPKAYESRLIVIGDQITAAAIQAGNARSYVDWRADYNDLTYELTDPPADVVTAVRELDWTGRAARLAELLAERGDLRGAA